MKMSYLFVFLGLTMLSCSEEDSVVYKQEEQQIPYVPQFPFEALDQTNFNNTSASLTAAPSNVRLDSVVTFRYYRFNPESNLEARAGQVVYSADPVAGVPPEEPTNKRTEIYRYTSFNRVDRIDAYSNFSKNFIGKGNLVQTDQFAYNEENNIIHFRRSGFETDNPFDYSYDYVHGFLFEYLDNKLNSFQEYSGNTLFSPKEINVSENEISINDVVYHNGKNGYTYGLDSFGNVVSHNYFNSPQEKVNDYFYPKNIYNPFCNLFPSSYKAFMCFYEISMATTHFISRYASEYDKEIQLHVNGFPEIIQSGSYDNGYRTLYYYSTY